ncbi:hypothetical protein [Pandoraea communis]|uniref:hypothetical protein n=1 Tax=Pandoraea communis TaxID=2508297 RepID=UPI0012417752|nr:hypothetical protein [Pandoraea communis]
MKRRFYLDTFPVAVGLLVAFLLIASPQLLAALNGGNELPWERPPVNAVTVLQLRLLAQFVGGVFAWIAIEYFDRRW